MCENEGEGWCASRNGKRKMQKDRKNWEVKKKTPAFNIKQKYTFDKTIALHISFGFFFWKKKTLLLN